MRSPRLSNPWPAVKAAPLPAATALLAGAVLLGQLVLPVGDPELPMAVIPTAGAARPVAGIAVVPAYPAIVAAPIFSPNRSGGAGSGPGATAGDLILLGTVTTRRGAVAVLQSDAGPQSVPIGRSFGAWRLVGVGRDRATFTSAAGTRTVRIGEAPRPSPDQPDAEQAQ